MSKTVLFQTVQFSISTLFICQNSFISNNSVYFYFTAITPVQNGPVSDDNKVVLLIAQSASITRTSPSDYLVSFRILVGGGTYCNVMAEGFQLMPLGLVRLRTFRLSTWVS